MFLFFSFEESQHSACYQFKRLRLQRYEGARPRDAGENTIRARDASTFGSILSSRQRLFQKKSYLFPKD